MERIEIYPGYSISRVIKGGWHLAGGHGKIEAKEAIADMRSFVEAGITTFDCADIYTGVEDLIGSFLKTHQSEMTSGLLPEVQIHTKYVPDYDKLGQLRKEDTERIIDRSLSRLGVERLDMVQFAWWDPAIPGWLETAVHLHELQQAGKIRLIGLTNFNTDEVVAIIDAGVRVVSNQVQYSVMDHRPAVRMADLAQEKDFYFFCYGVVAGGFLSDRYLGASFPEPPYENRSLTKYQLIIEEFGGLALFQEALEVLRAIGDKNGCTIAQVACAYILQKPRVAAIIVGARNKNHLTSLIELNEISLSDSDILSIDAVRSKSNGPGGTVYALERDKSGKHGAIMKYNLNEQ